jgi:hypothetical protein
MKSTAKHAKSHGLDSDTAWLAMCKKHGTMVQAMDRKDASSMETSDFCDECREEVK